MYFDRNGAPISIDKWAATLESDRRIAEITLPDGKWVSTVWIGLNHRFGVGPPLIFETMVFPSSDDFGELDMERYATESEAIEGHNQMVDKWSRKVGQDEE